MTVAALVEVTVAAAAVAFREWDAHIGVMDILPPFTPLIGAGGMLQKPSCVMLCLAAICRVKAHT